MVRGSRMKHLSNHRFRKSGLSTEKVSLLKKYLGKIRARLSSPLSGLMNDVAI
jgi:hypothetical protein